MTRPYQRWNALWQLFVMFYETWRDDFPDEESVMLENITGWPTESLDQALREWHEAFDSADDAEVSRIVGDFNPAYDPSKKFGGDREWAEWVKQHLEGELARRA